MAQGQSEAGANVSEDEFVEVEENAAAPQAPVTEISEGVLASVDQALAEEESAEQESAEAAATDEAAAQDESASQEESKE